MKCMEYHLESARQKISWVKRPFDVQQFLW